MHLFFDVVLGVGLACAAGLRPFLPVVLTGGLAEANVRVDFTHTHFSFLESAAFLIAMAACAALSIALERRIGGERVERGPLGSALGGISLGLGAVLFAGCLAKNGYLWWPGIIGGLLFATLGQAAGRGLFGRVRSRLDREAQAALPIYAEGGALLAAALTLLFPPLAILLAGFMAWLLLGGRRREQQKFAGLRILR